MEELDLAWMHTTIAAEKLAPFLADPRYAEARRLLLDAQDQIEKLGATPASIKRTMDAHPQVRG